MSAEPAEAAKTEEQLLDEADEVVTQFIAENCHSGSVSQQDAIENSVREFVRFHQERHAQSVREVEGSVQPLRFALVTSGGTVTPLERKEIRHITNLSTGRRGSASCEEFLRLGYKVCFLYKTGCLMPFMRHFQDGAFAKHCSVVSAPNNNTGSDTAAQKALSFTDSSLIKAVEEYQYHAEKEKNIVYIPFHTVVDYQLCMRSTLNTLRASLNGDMTNVMVYLVAAVADFYVPYAQLPPEKIDSRPDDDSMTLYLHKVPKALARGLVGRRWGAGAFVTTFKLETDETRIDAKVMKHINAFSNIKLVCANLLSGIRSEVRVHDVRDPANPTPIRKEAMDHPDALEERLVAHVVKKHDEFIQRCW